jgi:arginine-tRNA-protein transferase
VSSPQQEYDTLHYVSAESPCPYLPGFVSRNEAYFVEQMAPELYVHLVDRGFRRAGRIVYRPRCRACGECRPIRIRVSDFKPTRSMRRTIRRNADVTVDVAAPEATDEKYELFCRYLDAQHDDTMERSYDAFHDFLYDSPTETLEFHYRIGRRLIGVGLADKLSNGLSSVYMSFDPEFARRSLGTFSVLWELDYTRREGYPYYYLGYYVAQSRKMAYKGRFRPAEILVGDNRWVVFHGV